MEEGKEKEKAIEVQAEALWSACYRVHTISGKTGILAEVSGKAELKRTSAGW